MLMEWETNHDQNPAQLFFRRFTDAELHEGLQSALYLSARHQQEYFQAGRGAGLPPLRALRQHADGDGGGLAAERLSGLARKFN